VATAPAAATFGFGTPFAEQLDFFRRKLNLPTERWDDIMRAAHDRAFVVAGAAKADLLHELRGAVDKAIESRGLHQFRKDFRSLVQRTGWTGWTGEGSKAGEAWRTRVIYQTNMATSYAAGRRRQMVDPEFAAIRPYWKYVHSDGVLHPRPEHLRWDGLTLPREHEFWKTHFAPNGWGCRCEIHPVKAPAPGAATEPPAGWDDIDPKTGAPVGIDRGFDYAPGASTDVALRQMVQDKLITYPDAITAALSRDVTRCVNASEPAPAFVRRVLADPTVAEPLWLGFVDDFARIGQAAGAEVKGYLVLLPAEKPRHLFRDHEHDGGTQRLAQPDDYSRLAETLNSADSLRAGTASRHGNATVVATKRFGAELMRAVAERLPGKHNRSLALISLVVKVGR
jgi:hypothetical protein